MSNGYDRFVRKAANGAFYFTDATGACRGVVLSATDCGTAGIAARSVDHDVVGEAFAFYVDENNVMRQVADTVQARSKAKHSSAYEITSRNVLDYIARCNAY
jgi:hypothetical protein